MAGARAAVRVPIAAIAEAAASVALDKDPDGGTQCCENCERLSRAMGELERDMGAANIAGSRACNELAGGKPGYSTLESDAEWGRRIAAARRAREAQG